MELTEEQWLSGIESTLLNVVRLTRLVIPVMEDKRWGRIADGLLSRSTATFATPSIPRAKSGSWNVARTAD